MAQLWIKQRNKDGQDVPTDLSNEGSAGFWSVVKVEGENVDLGQMLAMHVDAGPADDVCAVLCRADEIWGERWLLIGEESVRVNGMSLLGGIHALAHRDEIRVAGREPVWLSTERMARVQPFPGFDRLTECPRCGLEIHPGQPAVQCPAPGCGTWVHMDPENGLFCWQYKESKSCPAQTCNQPNTLDDEEWAWIPDEA